jgi:hypothetical protein
VARYVARSLQQPGIACSGEVARLIALGKARCLLETRAWQSTGLLSARNSHHFDPEVSRCCWNRANMFAKSLPYGEPRLCPRQSCTASASPWPPLTFASICTIGVVNIAAGAAAVDVLLLHADHLVYASPENTQACRQWLEGCVCPHGSTDILHPLSQALRMLLSAPVQMGEIRLPVVFLLTDGAFQD